MFYTCLEQQSTVLPGVYYGNITTEAAVINAEHNYYELLCVIFWLAIFAVALWKLGTYLIDASKGYEWYKTCWLFYSFAGWSGLAC